MLKIFEQRDPPMSKPFRIIETTKTIDGPRDRITDKQFTTFAEAAKYVSDMAIK